MIFVNSIAGMKAIPNFLRHAPAEMDAYTLTDVVFPGFLFIVGVAIPLALKGESRREILGARPGPDLLRTAGLVSWECSWSTKAGIRQPTPASAASSGICGLLGDYRALEHLSQAGDGKRRTLPGDAPCGVRPPPCSHHPLSRPHRRRRCCLAPGILVGDPGPDRVGLSGLQHLFLFSEEPGPLMGVLVLLIALNAGNHLGILNFLGAAGPMTCGRWSPAIRP